MKKGFTLIELLAVLVILAIILLVAVPIVLNIIDDAEKEGLRVSKENYLDAVEQAIYRKKMAEKFKPTTCIVVENGNLQCDAGYVEVEVNGQVPTAGKIVFENTKIVSNVLVFGKRIEGEYYADDSEASIPDLYGTSLTPVVSDGQNVIIADPTKEWYNYEKQQWANAVILDSNANSEVGDIVTEEDILAVFVWIPRYEYKIEGVYGTHANGIAGTAETPGEIVIHFISKDTTTASEGYNIHPAFNFGGKELSGIWVGKYEISHTTLSSNTSGNNLNCSTENCESADGLRILPNVQSLRYNNVSNFFFAIRSMTRDENPFGLYSGLTDTHMMKNSEWGAVAYLSQSKYGKYGNSDNGGIEASTTGNISGVYNMNSGSEYVMGVYADAGGNLYSGSYSYGYNVIYGSYGYYNFSSGFTGKIYNSSYSQYSTWYTGVSFPKAKYYDVYRNNDHLSYKSENLFKCSGNTCNGHALSETSGWYNSSNNLIYNQYPWFTRGGSTIFSSGRAYGFADSSISTRVVLVSDL